MGWFWGIQRLIDTRWTKISTQKLHGCREFKKLLNCLSWVIRMKSAIMMKWDRLQRPSPEIVVLLFWSTIYTKLFLLRTQFRSTLMFMSLESGIRCYRNVWPELGATVLLQCCLGWLQYLKSRASRTSALQNLLRSLIENGQTKKELRVTFYSFLSQKHSNETLSRGLFYWPAPHGLVWISDMCPSTKLFNGGHFYIIGRQNGYPPRQW